MKYIVTIEDQDTALFSTFESDDLELAIEQAKQQLIKGQEMVGSE